MAEQLGVGVAADPAVLELEFGHVHRLLDPAASGLQRWEVVVHAGTERVGVLRVARAMYWLGGNLRARMADEGSLLAAVAAELFMLDGSFSAEFEEAVDIPGNILVVEELELAAAWADPVVAASLVSSAVDRLASNGFAVVLPRSGAVGVEGAALLEEAGALLAGEVLSSELPIIDTALASPEEAARRVRRLLEARTRNGGRDVEEWEEEDDEEGWELTARTRAVLRLALDDLSGVAWEEVAALGDEALKPGAAGLFADLPRVTFHQNWSWRRQMARTFDDLAGDLEAGRDLVPGCTGEEMALHLAISRAEQLVRDRPRLVADAVAALPADRYDFDWECCSDLLFEDHDVLMLFDARLDGIEDPTAEASQALGMVNLAPLDWFTPFNSERARNPERGFRHD
ncbi:hypothetical protein KV557_00375 [Kitasatospora aureofaciens]|uniref:hypothetical protein n=1 Tax=Kitasatospora aureofaciens TaxID=1894 RepID=UPI001C46D94E|nr:hypothetical protein [Kitasatospora aureofaciens]MBV6695581.1 hypothetical protein [Kitasatospora aureofaciens]